MMWKSQVGQYGENVRMFDQGVKTFDQADDMQIYAVCEALLETRDYGRLFPCLDNMDRRIEQGTYSVFMMPTEGMALMSKLLRARGLLDLGEIENALVVAESTTLPNTITGKSAYWLGYYGIRALTHALSDHREEALFNLAKLEEEDNFLMKKEKNSYVARIYMALGDYDKALEAVERDTSPSGFNAVAQALAYPIASVVTAGVATAAGGTTEDGLKMLVGDDVRAALPYAFMVAKLHLETGEMEAARHDLDAVLNHPRIANFGGLHWAALHNRASIHLKEGEVEQGLTLLKKAVELVERHRSSIQGEAGRIGFVGDKQAVYRDLVAALVQTGQPAEAFEYAERGKARALVDMLAGKKAFATGNKTDLEPLMAQWQEAERDDATAGIRITTPTKRRSAQARALSLRKKIKEYSLQIAALVTVNTPTLEEIRKQLPEGETLVEYFGSDDTFFAFIVNHDEVYGVKLEVKELRQKIEAFREHLMDPDSYQCKVDGQALYEKLIQPIEGFITSKNLTIVPHGALHYLPFNALYEKDSFLIDRYNIRVLPSASVMTFLKDRREGHAGNLLAFGNPDLGDPIYDLPGAQNETIAITKDRPKSKLLLRKQATETAIKRFGDQFRYIHFATHGTFDAEKPLSSGLLLVGDSENDGMLTVNELYDLSLPADLVTLSACETALGKVANGDDVVGFTRGFLYAGVSSIVSSLWKVDDQATSILMQEFYKSLKETDKRSALRTAQLKVKDTYHAHPYYWAAFQITGSVQ
jgi:CHAT domain-containing protein